MVMFQLAQSLHPQALKSSLGLLLPGELVEATRSAQACGFVACFAAMPGLASPVLGARLRLPPSPKKETIVSEYRSVQLVETALLGTANLNLGMFISSLAILLSVASSSTSFHINY